MSHAGWQCKVFYNILEYTLYFCTAWLTFISIFSWIKLEFNISVKVCWILIISIIEYCNQTKGRYVIAGLSHKVSITLYQWPFFKVLTVSFKTLVLLMNYMCHIGSVLLLLCSLVECPPITTTKPVAFLLFVYGRLIKWNPYQEITAIRQPSTTGSVELVVVQGFVVVEGCLVAIAYKYLLQTCNQSSHQLDNPSSVQCKDNGR